jgi:hypothetical protein
MKMMMMLMGALALSATGCFPDEYTFHSLTDGGAFVQTCCWYLPERENGACESEWVCSSQGCSSDDDCLEGDFCGPDGWCYRTTECTVCEDWGGTPPWAD